MSANNATGIVVFASNGIVSGAVISGNIAAGNLGAGITVSGDSTVTSDNLIYGNSGDGLSVSGYGVYVLNNIIYTNGGNGISVSNDYATISGNNVTGSLYNGIYVSGANAHITGNNVTNNGWAGIVVNGAGATVTDNIVFNNCGDGIYVTGNGATITGNNVFFNLGSGIVINGNNSIVTGNNVNYNGGKGIVINSAENTQEGTHNGFLIVGTAMFTLVESLGIDLSAFSLPELPAVAEVLACLSGVTLDEVLAGLGLFALDLEPVGWAITIFAVGAVAYDWLTTNHPDQTTTDTTYLQNMQSIGTILSICALQSELGDDENPLTSERLEEDSLDSAYLLWAMSEDDSIATELEGLISTGQHDPVREYINRKTKEDSGELNAKKEALKELVGGGSRDPREVWERVRNALNEAVTEKKWATAAFLTGAGLLCAESYFLKTYFNHK